MHCAPAPWRRAGSFRNVAGTKTRQPRMRPLSLTAALVLLARLLIAQCPDGSPPPCRVLRATPDPHVIAILPFRVTGADSSYGEGVAEVVAAEFTGEGGSRSADMGAVLRAWQRAGGTARTPLAPGAATRVALQVGAGRLVTGSVVGLRGRLTLTALVVRVPDGAELARSPSIQGPEDSLPVLLRRLSANLLLVGEPGTNGELRGAGTSSPEALRAYMAGLADYRRGRYEWAAGHLDRALEADSGFLLAASARFLLAGWAVEIEGPDFDQLAALVWRGRDRLGPGGRALVEAQLGPRYPELSPQREFLDACERATRVTPEAAEAWYFLGDLYFHSGAFLGFMDARRRSADAFERSLALDSTAGVLSHLLELAVLDADTARARSVWDAYRRFAKPSDFLRQSRWQVAILLGDTAMLQRAHRAADSMSVSRLRSVANVVQLAGLAVNEADTALAHAERRSSTQDEWEEFVAAYVAAAINQGWPSRAEAMLDRLGENRMLLDIQRLNAAVAVGMDAGIAAPAADRLAQVVDGPAPEDSIRRRWYYRGLCALERWRVESEDLNHTPRAVQVLESASGAVNWKSARFCASLLAAWAEGAGVRGFEGALARFDSVMRTGPQFTEWYVPLALARAHDARGDHRAALAAVRRREYFNLDRAPNGLAVFLREEGRLASLTGDTAAAIHAYRHYLVLRRDPEPILIPQRDSVAAALARLQARR